jgi:hypothetical protein
MPESRIRVLEAPMPVIEKNELKSGDFPGDNLMM